MVFDVYTHTQGIQMGARAGTQGLTAISRQSTIEWKHGTNGRQGKIGNQDTPLWESQSSDLTVFSLPLT